MTKNIKYLLIIITIACNIKLKAQIIFKKDSCFLNNESGLQKLNSFENKFLKGKKSKKGYVICKNKEEFIKQFHTTEQSKLDSIVNIINFNENGVLCLITSNGGCTQPKIDFYSIKNKIQVYTQIDGGCYPLWNKSHVIIVPKILFNYDIIEIYPCEKWIKN